MKKIWALDLKMYGLRLLVGEKKKKKKGWRKKKETNDKKQETSVKMAGGWSGGRGSGCEEGRKKSREKLSYLCCNRGTEAFADWSCHGDGWHLVHVCVCVQLDRDCYLCVWRVVVFIRMCLWASGNVGAPVCVCVWVFVCAWRWGIEWGILLGGLSVLSKANEEGDQRGNSKAPTSPHCKHTIRRRRVCVLTRARFFFFPPQRGRDVDLLNSAAGTVARKFHGAERVAPIWVWDGWWKRGREKKKIRARGALEPARMNKCLSKSSHGSMIASPWKRAPSCQSLVDISQVMKKNPSQTKTGNADWNLHMSGKDAMLGKLLFGTRTFSSWCTECICTVIALRRWCARPLHLQTMAAVALIIFNCKVPSQLLRKGHDNSL